MAEFFFFFSLIDDKIFSSSIPQVDILARQSCISALVSFLVAKLFFFFFFGTKEILLANCLELNETYI